MRVVDEILREDRDRERRLRAAREAAEALTKEELRTFLAEQIRRIENGSAKGAKRQRRRSITPAEAVTAPPTVMRSAPEAAKIAPPTSMIHNVAEKPKFVDLAEAYVAKHPNGVTVTEVAEAIGQNEGSADGTLRHLARSRGSIEKQDGRWVPTGVKPSPPKATLRTTILAVLCKGKPLGTGDVHEAVLKTMPDALRPSVGGEIGRLKTEGLIIERGRGARGPLYVLANGGGHATAE
jgi:hypothetical protein